MAVSPSSAGCRVESPGVVRSARNDIVALTPRRFSSSRHQEVEEGIEQAGVGGHRAGRLPAEDDHAAWITSGRRVSSQLPPAAG
jgi:hypothetical protein